MDDADDDKLLLQKCWSTKSVEERPLALFPAGTIVE